MVEVVPCDGCGIRDGAGMIWILFRAHVNSRLAYYLCPAIDSLRAFHLRAQLIGWRKHARIQYVHLGLHAAARCAAINHISLWPCR